MHQIPDPLHCLLPSPFRMLKDDHLSSMPFEDTQNVGLKRPAGKEHSPNLNFFPQWQIPHSHPSQSRTSKSAKHQIKPLKHKTFTKRHNLLIEATRKWRVEEKNLCLVAKFLSPSTHSISNYQITRRNWQIDQRVWWCGLLQELQMSMLLYIRLMLSLVLLWIYPEPC